MNETISDQELRRRLSAFNSVVPPVTGSTRKLLLKKLANLESNQIKQNAASKIMPPPKSKASTNSTNESVMISSSVVGGKQSQYLKFDSMDSPRKSTRRRQQYRAPDPFETSDSEVDAGTLGHSLLPANPKIASSSPKSNETSLMNVSNWKNSLGTNDNGNSYLSPDIKKTLNQQTNKIIPGLSIPKVNENSSKPVGQKLYLKSATNSLSNADQAILRWKEKIINQSRNENNISNTLFNSPSPIPKVSSKNSRRNIQSVQQILRGNHTKNTPYIILLITGFFVAVFGLYFISSHSNTIFLPSGILNSLCAKKGLQESNCVAEQEKVQHLYNSLVSHVHDKYIKNQCENSDTEPTVSAQTAFEFISTHENIPSREIEELVELFKSIAKTYSDSPIGYDTSFKTNKQPNLPIMCAVKHIFSNMFYLITWIGIVALCVIGLYFVICYVTTKGEKYKEEVNRLVEMTIDLLKEQAINRPNESYLPIIHIRDHLIPFSERQSKTKIWADVVQYFTESESSVRSEVQEIDGEDFQVWRWVQPMSPSI